MPGAEILLAKNMLKILQSIGSHVIGPLIGKIIADKCLHASAALQQQ
jgi:hypothetical protein